MPTKILIIILAHLPLLSCGTEVRVASPPSRASASAHLLADGLTGSFSSVGERTHNSKQAMMTIHSVSIWPDRQEKRWMYCESTTPTAGITQQIHAVGPGPNGDLALEVFSFPEGRTPPQGTYSDPTWFNRLDPMFLVPHAGCTVFFTQNKSAFTGKTQGEGCPDTTNNADYTTEELTVRPDEIRRWYRGWSRSGALVHGSPTGPRVFTRTGQ